MQKEFQRSKKKVFVVESNGKRQHFEKKENAVAWKGELRSQGVKAKIIVKLVDRRHPNNYFNC